MTFEPSIFVEQYSFNKALQSLSDKLECSNATLYISTGSTHIYKVLEVLALSSGFKAIEIYIKDSSVSRGLKEFREMFSDNLNKHINSEGITPLELTGAVEFKRLSIQNKVSIKAVLGPEESNESQLVAIINSPECLDDLIVVSGENQESLNFVSCTSVIKRSSTQAIKINYLIHGKSTIDLTKVFQSLLDDSFNLLASGQEIYPLALYKINSALIGDRNLETRVLKDLGKSDFKYQADGVTSLIAVLNRYNLAYLADSPGLGKTITTLRLIARLQARAIIVVPTKAVYKQWKELVSRIHYLGIEVCLDSCTALTKAVASSKEFDLVIFDEAQEFRNEATERYQRAQELCSGSKVILVGATPVNNRLLDLKNQLMLGLNPKCSYDFGVGILEDFFKQAEAASKSSPEQSKLWCKAIQNQIVSKLMIRRTKETIKTYYQDDLASGNLKFPCIEAPKIVRYDYGNFLVSSTVDILSGKSPRFPLRYALYNQENYRKDVENHVENVEKGETNVAGFMRVHLLKMLDSSPATLCKALFKFREKLRAKLQEVTDYGVLYSEKYKLDLESDLEAINWLINTWSKFRETETSKLEELLEVLLENPSKKVVIFTEFLETQSEVYRFLDSKGYQVIAVNGQNQLELQEDLFSSFNSSGDPKLFEHNILISTDILSEGVNLNRAGVIINYDMAWNPMVINQRVGRLDRLDSCESLIRVYNFLPNETNGTSGPEESIANKKIAIAMQAIGNIENYINPSLLSPEDFETLTKRTEQSAKVQIGCIKYLDYFQSISKGYKPQNKVLISYSGEDRWLGLFESFERIIPVLFTESTQKLDYLTFYDTQVILESLSFKQKLQLSSVSIPKSFKLVTGSLELAYIQPKTLGNNQLRLVAFIDRLHSNIEKSKTHSRSAKASILYNLDLIKEAIKAQEISEHLCRVYYSSIINQLDSVEASKSENDISTNQYLSVISTIPKRLWHTKYSWVKSQSRLKLLALVGI